MRHCQDLNPPSCTAVLSGEIQSLQAIWKTELSEENPSQAKCGIEWIIMFCEQSEKLNLLCIFHMSAYYAVASDSL